MNERLRFRSVELCALAFLAFACSEAVPGAAGVTREPATASVGPGSAVAAAEQDTPPEVEPSADPLPAERESSAPLQGPTPEVRAPDPAPEPGPVVAVSKALADDPQSAPDEEGEGKRAIVALAPGLRIDREKRRVEAEAEVCLTQGALELLVTTPDGKPHEAIFTLKPKPRQLHAALLILGLEAGAPGHYGAFGATGDRVRLSVAFDLNGEDVVIPVNKLVVNNDTDEYLPDNVFVFAGSLLARAREGNRLIYAADVAGDVVSLVSFPDEVLALPDPASSENGRLVWSVDGSHLPDVGTPVVLRIEPVER